MEPKPSIMALEEVATELIDSGCYALFYDKELAEKGKLHLTTFLKGLWWTIGVDECKCVPSEELHNHNIDPESITTKSEHIFLNVEHVTVGDQTVPFCVGLAVGSIDPLGRCPLYVNEHLAAIMDTGVEKQSLDDGLAAVEVILQEDK